MPHDSAVTILWECLDVAGHDCVTLVSDDDGWRLEGSAVRVENGMACRLVYQVNCDMEWRSRRASVTGVMGSSPVSLDIRNAGRDNWTVNGHACPDLDGCTDLDLGFTPATNLLPIRRLGLSVGQSADIKAAWLRFPELEFSVLDQHYQRIGHDSYRYRSSSGRFETDLQVQAHGFVVDYPGLWQALA